MIAYDRAGLGESERAGRRRTLIELTRDLKVVLDSSQTPGPNILGGHSIGAYIVRYFPDQHPDQVAGLVLLVDFGVNVQTFEVSSPS